MDFFFFFQTVGSWINIPTAIPDCPPGLEYLAAVDQLLVKQKIELFEAFTGFETNNKFVIKNAMGQNVSMNCEERDHFIDTSVFVAGILGC